MKMLQKQINAIEELLSPDYACESSNLSIGGVVNFFNPNHASGGGNLGIRGIYHNPYPEDSYETLPRNNNLTYIRPPSPEELCSGF